MNTSLSDALGPEYGKNDMEKLASVIFEAKEDIPETTYMLLNELLVKVDKMIEHVQDKAHWFHFRIITTLINATDNIKEDLDDMADNYNSDYEDHYDYDDEDNVQTIITQAHCKIYLKEEINAVMFLEDIHYIYGLLKESGKNKKSFDNYNNALIVAMNKQIKLVATAIKDNIDPEWVKVEKTAILPDFIKVV